jgi:DNA-binding beta-propeller fold protein YncE
MKFLKACTVSLAGAACILLATNSASLAVELNYKSTISSPGSGPENIFLPQGITVQPSTGYVWISDGEGDRLQVFTKRGKFVKTVGSSGTGLGQINEPADLTFENETGNLYVGDVFNNRIDVFDAEGKPIKFFGSFGAPVQGRQFSGPGGLAFGKDNNLYVTDFSSDFIQVFNREGELLRKVGEPGTELGQFQGPSGISVSERTGNFYVGDQLNNRIQVLSPEGKPLFAFGEPGTGPGQFNQPIGVELDEFDNVYVSDSVNSRIQVFNKDGKYLTAFGKPVENAGPKNILQPGQPLPEPGLFNWTAGAHYYKHKLYVGDFFNSRIQVLKVTDQETRGEYGPYRESNYEDLES